MPKGRSLHVGLNRVDPAVYGSECPLGGCHNDARAMAAIAEECGYEERTVLLDAAATREAVLARLGELARSSVAGDSVLISYAGHGGSVADLSGDELDGRDETWCLFDCQLVDDELAAAFAEFRNGVVVALVSDSCHSGTVARGIAPFADSSFRHRRLPAAAALSAGRGLHDLLAPVLRRRRTAPAAPPAAATRTAPSRPRCSRRGGTPAAAPARAHPGARCTVRSSGRCPRRRRRTSRGSAPPVCGSSTSGRSSSRGRDADPVLLGGAGRGRLGPSRHR